MSNELGKPGSYYKIPGNKVTERARRCGNCVRFENEEISKQHWRACRQKEQANLIQKTGLLENPLFREGDETGSAQRDARFEAFDKGVASGRIGICLAGGVNTDFVHHEYLCEKWSGRDGHSIITVGFKDKLTEELHED